ncbi:trypsin-like peptidase [Herbihabitans rhizosphaerae]|uniref:Trypsin-like peptidase n=1 Tax=Herbihabitans rhizosphaerae TaxID=1872711 RepID=A0A4Q7L7C3_9PSEU|nr:trypsin-like peptidase domain-containing protein [Herbihabitans rhizosphaerae]RZS45196.1 trypsin-like peptidase [Herbihabitans rhizosphaerae]
MARRALLTTVSTLVGVVASIAFAGTASASAAPTAPPKAAEVTFAGALKLSNCSGSVVRLSTSKPEDPALAMSNGHCLESGMPAPGKVIVNQPNQRSFELLDASGNSVATLRATKIVYATMTGTDVSLYQLSTTYAEIQSQHGIAALELNEPHPEAGKAISVVSGYWKEIYKCSVDGFVFELREGGWSWKDSIRYTPGCATIGGTSGSPIVDDASGKVVGVNNTANEDGQECTMNNPCEVDESGNITVKPDARYGQQTYLFYGCMADKSEIDLAKPECKLAKPAAVAVPVPASAA